jgi:hypothetical protein
MSGADARRRAFTRDPTAAVISREEPTMRSDPLQPPIRLTSVVALLSALGGCAGGMSAPALPYGQPSTADAGLRHINGPVLQANPSRTLSEVVGTYWPTLGARGPATFTNTFGDQIGVYANGALIGGLAELRSIRSGDVAHLRLLTRSEEQARFGRVHPQGAIVLTWKPR